MPGPGEIYRFGEYELRVRSRTLLRDGAAVALPSKSFEVLHYLVANSGRVVSKEELLRGVWRDAFVEEGNLAQHVFRLRKVLQERNGHGPWIVTIPGEGYQFSAIVESAQDPGRSRVHDSGASVSPPATGGKTASRKRISRTWLAVAALLLVVLSLGAWQWMRRAGSRRTLLPVMIAPFANRTGDASFDLTLANALTIDMEQSPYFDVLSKADLRKTLTLMRRPPNTRITDSLAREICQRNNDRVMIAGAIDKLGNLFSVTLEATDCGTGKSVASERAEAASKEQVLKNVDRITAILRRRLGESETSVQRFSVPLLPVETSSFDAVRDYSEAVDLYGKGRPDDAVPPLKHAIELDPNFALAYADLAIIYDNMSQQEPAVENITKAYALRNTVGDRSRFPLMAAYYAIATGDLNEAMRSAQVWTETFPQDATPWNRLANIQESLGEFPQALASAKKAAALAPANAGVLTTLARAYYHDGRFREAAEVCRQAIQRGIDGPAVHAALLRLAWLQNDRESQSRELAWSRTGLPERTLLMQSMALDLREGKLHDARTAADRAVEEGNKRGLGAFASIYALDSFLLTQVGLNDQARALLEEPAVANDLSNGLVASALAGDAAAAQSAIAQRIHDHPADTLLVYVYAPQVRAAAALRQNRPRDAIAALGPSLAYRMRDFHIPSLLAAAYLAAGMPENAEREYQQILDHPGIDPLSMQYPLARLGLARALSAENRLADARRQYQQFLDDWKSADADLPVMLQARSEYAKISGEN